MNTVEFKPTLKFVINTYEEYLVCPDGSTTELKPTDHDGEFYAEWRDIGVFYYPNGSDGESEASYWIQGQLPSYPGNPYLDERDGVYCELG